jgi:pectinesterase
VVYIDCEMGSFVRPEGWDNWKDPKNEATAWYAEIGSTGAGANPAARVRWSRQLSPAEAAEFLPDHFLH